jgi:glycogen operon protein
MSETPVMQSTALGVTLHEGGGTFRIYSANANSVKFVVVDALDPKTELTVLECSRGEGDVWEVSSELIVSGVHYAIQVDGPDSVRNGFNPEVDLIDPYARGVVREGPRDFHNVVIDRSFDWQGVTKPNIPMGETVIYETHARGLTRGNNELPDELKGTYAALAHPSTIAHLKKIGVTAVELLPVQMFISEPRLMNMGLINYWGYNTINFFTPHHRYATASAIAAGPEAIVREFKTMVRELHRAGLEVILDVVYNHTAEGGNRGLTHSFRGIDNAAYYRVDDLGNYHDTTGCGNSLNFANPRVVDLVLDSLRYWTEEMQIDGFRFDLATTLARDANNQYDPNHPTLQGMLSDPIISSAKLIAEPWDVGLGGWQTGNFPDEFSEWNDRYRDSIRRFWLSDIANHRNSGYYGNGVADLATRLAGSKDIVHGSRGTSATINFIAAHDGFTLHDLVSYNVKHNNMNGESNRDGTGNNYSYNFGAEGLPADDTIVVERHKMMRNLLATLLFSSGVPMIAAGDERAKTQQGNNNAYCQDNVLSWVNWELSDFQLDLENTFSYLTKLRSENPSLRPVDFGNFEKAEFGTDLIRWYNRDGGLMTEDDWNSHETRVIQRLNENLDEQGKQNLTLLVINGSEEDVNLTLPTWETASTFEMLWNSAGDEPKSESKTYAAGENVAISECSVMLFRATTS